MSTENISNGSAIINGAFENETNSLPRSESQPRFRISKLPSIEDITDAGIPGVSVTPTTPTTQRKQNGGTGNSTPEKAEDTVVDETPSSPPSGKHEKHHNPATGEKHVHLHLPDDHNETVTHNQRTHTNTMGYLTHDAVPLSVFYRNQESMENVTSADKRPTLDQLHKGEGLENAKKRHWDASKTVEPVHNVSDIENTSDNNKKTLKLGWIKGVLFPTLLNIWGVILFLRMPWIVANAGIGLSSIVVILATCVTTITALSMSAICTNGEVKGGGAYFLISRSLGPEFGGSIGIIFSVANAVAVALYLVGFGETVQALMGKDGIFMVDVKNDVRIIGLISLVIIFVITQVGLDWVIHTQSGLLALLLAAIVSVVAGTALPNPQESRETMKSYGLPGYSIDLFKENFGPDYESGAGFFDVFSIFFPAATGIMAGANLSGDLKDPSKAVPVGTLLAIGVTSVVYVILCWLIGSSVMRFAPGPLILGSQFNISSVNTTLANNVTTTTVTTIAKAVEDYEFGARNDLQIIERMSLWGPLVLIGIFAATLSSALASLVSAPKVFQAVSKDKIFPGIEIFAKGYGRSGEPRNGYLLTLVIAAGFIAIGDLNVIAPIISNFFLMAYALINYAVFASSLSKSPGWRPAFKYYNMWISLVGFLLCMAIMFLINWWAALITLLAVAGLYKWVDVRKPDINWGSSGQAHTFLKALRFTRRLEDTAEHVKNFRIQCLCLTGQPSLRPNLVHFASHITRHLGMLICGEVVLTDKISQTIQQHEGKWLRKHKVKAFHQIVQNPTLRGGINSMLQAVGLGKLRPNTLLLGYMNRWQHAEEAKIDEFYSIIHDAFDLRYGVGILRLQDGFDITDGIVDDQIENGVVDNHEPDWYTEDWDESQKQSSAEHPQGSDSNSDQGSARAKEGDLPNIVMAFDKKRKGYIDVWWLYDDGGLTILLPHLLSLSTHWQGCKLRIFTPASDKKIKANQIRMANLLKKFRIDFSSVVEFRGINKHPRDDSVSNFKRMRKGTHLPPDGILDKKTLRQIRLGELLHEHSSEAKLIVLTLPIPKKSVVTSLMYMSWLEVLSADLPPIMMVRGNQTSVLTFYS